MTVLVEVLDQAELVTLRRNYRVVGVVQPEAPLIADPQVRLPQQKVDLGALAGSLPAGVGEQMQRDIAQSRDEWERDF